MRTIEAEFEMTGKLMRDITAKGKTLKRVLDREAADVCLWCGKSMTGQARKRGIHKTPCHGQYYMLIQRTAITRRGALERQLILEGKIREPRGGQPVAKRVARRRSAS